MPRGRICPLLPDLPVGGGKRGVVCSHGYKRSTYTGVIVSKAFDNLQSKRLRELACHLVAGLQDLSDHSQGHGPGGRFLVVKETKKCPHGGSHVLLPVALVRILPGEGEEGLQGQSSELGTERGGAVGG